MGRCLSATARRRSSGRGKALPPPSEAAERDFQIPAIIFVADMLHHAAPDDAIKNSTDIAVVLQAASAYACCSREIVIPTTWQP